MTWSAAQYRLFEDERNRPLRDLLAALPEIDARSAVDLGCGPGNSTELLATRLPQAVLLGIDASQDMIAAARRRLPHTLFELRDIGAWNDAGPFDVILANASLHWLPDHERLLPALAGRLGAGGCLAVQMPDNLDEPTHRLMREIAAQIDPGRAVAAAAARTAPAPPASYYRWLRAVCRKVDIWRTTYHHPLADGVRGIVEWFKGSALGPFLEPLGPNTRAEFIHRYTAALEPVYSPLPDGTVLLPFPRLFIVARR
ncbi:MAG TPA: trans-aconitate 2-methyltransferase [Steroidobacteraceae bacterium]|nr:trans-aconitate 2-methyltransferase [Steroidobacteraceae bacterium]